MFPVREKDTSLPRVRRSSHGKRMLDGGGGSVRKRRGGVARTPLLRKGGTLGRWMAGGTDPTPWCPQHPSPTGFPIPCFSLWHPHLASLVGGEEVSQTRFLGREEQKVSMVGK